jgi:hypothetical protein
MATQTRRSFAAPTPPSPPPPIPVGCHPEEAELIVWHLLPRFLWGSRHSDPFVQDHDDGQPWVCGAKPKDLARRLPAALSDSGELAWYCFSKLRTKDRRGVSRTVADGSGTWYGDAGPAPVVFTRDGGRRVVVGEAKHFTFLRKAPGSKGRGDRTGWRLRELRLRRPAGHRRHGQGGKADVGEEEGEEELVICKLYRSRSAASSHVGKVKAPPEAAGEKQPVTTEVGSGWASKGRKRSRQQLNTAPEAALVAKEGSPPTEDISSISWGAKQKRPRHQLTDIGGQGLKKEADAAALLAPKKEAPGEFNTAPEAALVAKEGAPPTDIISIRWGAKQMRPRRQLTADVGGQGLKKEADDAALLAPKKEEEEAPGEIDTRAALPLARPTPRIKVEEEVRSPTDLFDVLWNRVHLTVGNRPGYRSNRPYRSGSVRKKLGYRSLTEPSKS